MALFVIYNAFTTGDLQCTSKRNLQTVFEPTNKTELQTAVNAWCANQSSAEIAYGSISIWDTGLITDMSNLFYGKTTCNPAIGAWDTSQVTIHSFICIYIYVCHICVSRIEQHVDKNGTLCWATMWFWHDSIVVYEYVCGILIMVVYVFVVEMVLVTVVFIITW